MHDAELTHGDNAAIFERHGNAVICEHYIAQILAHNGTLYNVYRHDTALIVIHRHDTAISCGNCMPARCTVLVYGRSVALIYQRDAAVIHEHHAESIRG